MMRSNALCRLDRGFTLVELVVALAVILILAAVAMPNVAGYLDQKRIDATAEQLASIRDALFDPTGNGHGFNPEVGNTNAGRLSELTSPLSNSSNYATGTDDSCGGTFSGGQRNDWLDEGPFTTYISNRTTGMMTPIGLAEDSLTRVPDDNEHGHLLINFLSVRLDDAIALDEKVDGTVGGWNADVVQWTPQNGTNGMVHMTYWVLIDDEC